MAHFFDDFELGIQPEELDPRENMEDFKDELNVPEDSHLDERFETDSQDFNGLGLLDDCNLENW